MLNIPTKKIAYTPRRPMCVHTVLRKSDIFCGRYEKTKHVSQKALLLAPNFVFFTQLKEQVDFS
jgi:hypothetical protein